MEKTLKITVSLEGEGKNILMEFKGLQIHEITGLLEEIKLRFQMETLENENYKEGLPPAGEIRGTIH